MKITCRILNLGVIDEYGEMFAKDCQFTFGDTVLVTDAGKQGIEHVEGTATIQHCGDHLEAVLDVRDDSPSGKVMKYIKDSQVPMKMYPAVNGFVMDRGDRIVIYPQPGEPRFVGLLDKLKRTNPYLASLVEVQGEGHIVFRKAFNEAPRKR